MTIQGVYGLSKFGGAFSFAYRLVINTSSKISVNANEIVCELANNSKDAGATEIQLVVTPSDITVIDNGRGLVPGMLEDDIRLIVEHFDDINKHNVGPNDNIRSLLSDTSKRSMMYMRSMVAFSGKFGSTDDIVTGSKGIGLQNTRSLARSVKVYSRPDAELASQYWSATQLDNPPVFCFSLPTQEELDAYQLDGTIEESSDPFTDVYGRPIEHGTVVVLRDFKPGAITYLRIESLRDALSRSLGQYIKRGNKVTIIDRFSEEGQKTLGGKTIEVNAPNYDGEIVLSLDNSLKKGRGHFHGEVFFTLNRRGTGIQLRRKGADVALLRRIEPVSKGIWVRNELSGFIEFPSDLTDETEWDQRKEVPLPGGVTDQWIKAILKYEEQLEEAVHEIEERFKSQRRSEASKKIANAALHAMSEMPELRSVRFTRAVSSKSKPRTKLPKQKAEERIIIEVLDEWDKGIPGVILELKNRSGQVIDRHRSGVSGRNSFGRRPIGVYRARVEIPPGMTLEDNLYGSEDEVVFSIDQPNQGRWVKFHLRTGSPSPETRLINNMIISYEPMSDVGILFDSKALQNGVLVINVNHEEYRRVHALNDEDAMEMLTASCLARAVGMRFLPHLPDEVDRAQVDVALLNKTYANLKGNGRKK